MSNYRPDYFQPTTPVETILRRIKGNDRRTMVTNTIERDGLESIPKEWLEHDLSAPLKSAQGSRDPGSRGGEDLPDLLGGEVEIARVSLVNSVHREVISLRGWLGGDGQTIFLRIVDEYCMSDGYQYKLEQESFPGPLTAEEVLTVFLKSQPCACLSSCEQRFSSDFYPNLDELADEHNVKLLWDDGYEESAVSTA
jgi:hypothetical protein